MKENRRKESDGQNEREQETKMEKYQTRQVKGGRTPRSRTVSAMLS